MGLFSKPDERSLRKRLHAVRMRALYIAEHSKTGPDIEAAVRAYDLADDLLAEVVAPPSEAHIERVEQMLGAHLDRASIGVETVDGGMPGLGGAIETISPVGSIDASERGLRALTKLRARGSK